MKLLIKNMQGTPQQPDPTRPGVGIPIKVRFSEPAHVDEAIPNQPARQEQGPRRMRIMPYMLEKYGFTEGCEGCRHKQAGLQGARDHSETCRVRIMEAIRQDTSDFGARMKQRHRNEIERMGRRDLHPEESQTMEHPEVLDHGRSHDGGEGSAASSTDAVNTPVDDAGLSPDVDMGLILNEAGVWCLLSIQATDTIGGDSKRDQGVAHEEDESLDHWPLVAWDDVTGSPLDPKEVQRARLKEMQYINSKQVYRKVLRADAKRRGIPILRTRWVDIDKGDDHEHNYRSRFVAMEFNTQKVNGLYASTPPLEALKLLISDAATRTSDTFKEEEEEEKVIMVNDVARAYFEAKVERTIAIELPVTPH